MKYIGRLFILLLILGIGITGLNWKIWFPAYSTFQEQYPPCCSPTIQEQLTLVASPGETVPLAQILITNQYYQTTANIFIEQVTVFPEPDAANLFIIPHPPSLFISSYGSKEATLFASLDPTFPSGRYRIKVRVRVRVTCTIFEKITITQTFTAEKEFILIVESEKEKKGERPFEVPTEMMEGVCGAPGSVLIIPARGIKDPEGLKWEGRVHFGSKSREARILAASKQTVLTVIPPGLKGKTQMRIVGPEGVSNTFQIRVDPSCASNGGKEITEKRLRELAREVPDHLKQRATDATGEILSFVPGEILLQAEISPEQGEALQKKYGIESLERLPGTNLFVARLKDKGVVNTLNTADQLKEESKVTFAMENGLMTEVEVPLNDPQLDQQEHLKDTNLFTGWGSFFPTEGVGTTIAVIDTGLDLALKEEIRPSRLAPNGIDISSGHQDLALLLGTSTAEDRRGHGTIVASIAAARGDNNQAGVGVSYNSRVIPIKVFGASRFTPKDVIAKGIIAAYLLDVDVINMSLGCARCRPSKERQAKQFFGAVLDMLEKQFEELGLIPPILVAATGNDGEGIVDSPASDPRVIAIGAYNLKKQRKSKFSNYGKEVDFVAPGENIFTTLMGGEFGGSGPGTSFASPQGAGLVALILSTEPKLRELGVKVVRQKIRECFSVDVGEPGFDPKTGWGLIKIPSPDEVDPSKCLIF